MDELLDLTNTASYDKFEDELDEILDFLSSIPSEPPDTMSSRQDVIVHPENLGQEVQGVETENLLSATQELQVEADGVLNEGQVIQGPNGLLMIVKINGSDELFAVPCELNSNGNLTITEKSVNQSELNRTVTSEQYDSNLQQHEILETFHPLEISTNSDLEMPNNLNFTTNQGNEINNLNSENVENQPYCLPIYLDHNLKSVDSLDVPQNFYQYNGQELDSQIEYINSSGDVIQTFYINKLENGQIEHMNQSSTTTPNYKCKLSLKDFSEYTNVMTSMQQIGGNDVTFPKFNPKTVLSKKLKKESRHKTPTTQVTKNSTIKSPLLETLCIQQTSTAEAVGRQKRKQTLETKNITDEDLQFMPLTCYSIDDVMEGVKTPTKTEDYTNVAITETPVRPSKKLFFKRKRLNMQKQSNNKEEFIENPRNTNKKHILYKSGKHNDIIKYNCDNCAKSFENDEHLASHKLSRKCDDNNGCSLRKLPLRNCTKNVIYN